MVPILTVTDEIAASLVAEALYRMSNVHRERGDSASASYCRELASSAEHQRVALWESRQGDTIDETDETASVIIEGTPDVAEVRHGSNG